MKTILTRWRWGFALGLALALDLPIPKHLRTNAVASTQSKKSNQASQSVADKKKVARPKIKNQAKGKPKKRKNATKLTNPSLHDRLVDLKQKYRLGEINRPAMWEKLAYIQERGTQLSRDDRVSLLQTQARMLFEADYPILAAIYASQAVKVAPNPRNKELEPTWDILRRVSEKRPIQNLLDIVADAVDLKGKTAPVFGSDWHYFAGNAAARRRDVGKALAYYNELKLNDRYFFPAKYQQAMLHIDRGRFDQAEMSLKAILFPASHKLSPLDDDTRSDLMDYALMALGRIYYEQERFGDAIKAYRQVSRNGANFYDALFEQSWAFFMGGYPMHALGSIYSVESPFFKGVFNPEAPVLRALVHYWLCRYEDSRNALADFMEQHGEAVENLSEFLDRQRLDSETAFSLFENLLSGVSGESLGVPRSILQTAAEKDSMLLVRDQFAAILEEKNRLEAKGIYGAKGTSLSRPVEYMERWDRALRKDVGRKFLAELQDMKRDYERLYAQAQFLYVELLMSEKDQLLGKELHANTKITKVSEQMKVKGWAGKTQSWKDSDKGEYWWDEIGWYITRVDSRCLISNTGQKK